MRRPLWMLSRRAGPIGVALTLFDIWRRIPPKHRKRIIEQSRKHGPRLIEQSRKHGPRIAKQLAERRRRPPR